MKRVLLLLTLSFGLCAFCADVVWDAFSILDNGRYGDVSYSSIVTFGGGNDCAYIDLMSTQSGNGVSIGAIPGGNPEGCCSWGLAFMGDVLNQDYFDNQSSYFYKYRIGGDMTEHADYQIDLTSGEEIYLAVMVTSYMHPSDGYDFGWIRIGTDESGNLYSVDSLQGLNGQSIIVGGGSVTPEPTTALLLLLGTGALCLRRRRLMLEMEYCQCTSL